MSEIRLALFQTLGRGVLKLHHHGLLALVKEPIMIQRCFIQKIKHRIPLSLLFHAHVILRPKTAKIINCGGIYPRYSSAVSSFCLVAKSNLFHYICSEMNNRAHLGKKKKKRVSERSIETFCVLITSLMLSPLFKMSCALIDVAKMPGKINS